MNVSKKFRFCSALLVTLIAGLSLAAPAVAEDTPLTEQMNIINKNVKKLRKDVKKAELNKESAALAKECAEAATKAKELAPATAAKVPAAEKDKFIAEYKKQMDDLIATFKELEKNLADNKNEDAEKLIEKVLDQKKKGHDKFTE